MSHRGTDTDLARDLTDLIRTLEDLQTELEPTDRRRLGLPTPRDVLHLTSEVAIPAAIVTLEANVRMLRLLQRAIRMRTDEDVKRREDTGAVRDRAGSIGREVMGGLDDALSELQVALEGRPGNDEARTLLAEARRLRREVEADLSGTDGDAIGGRTGPSGQTPVDVEAELQSIRDEVDPGDEGDNDDSDQ